MTYICFINDNICHLISKSHIYTFHIAFICYIIFNEHVHVMYYKPPNTRIQRIHVSCTPLQRKSVKTRLTIVYLSRMPVTYKEHAIFSRTDIYTIVKGVLRLFTFGSMAFGFVHLAAADSKWREVPEQVGRASHRRVVLAPVVVSAMHRTKLLGDATMQQINQLYAVACVASSFSWYVAPPITYCTHCAWQGHSDCKTTCHT